MARSPVRRHPIAACLQMCSGADVEVNIGVVETLVARAVAMGACFVATPENTTLLATPAAKLAAAETLDGPLHRRLGEIARRHGVWLLVGSVAERIDDRRCYNTSLLFDADGNLQAFYRKIHLFDVDVPGARFQESAVVQPGGDLTVCDTPIGRLGMSVCYDVRFPELYRGLSTLGATVISVPSAFTVPTGKDHWHLLVRARAVETQSWILAPAQEGAHGNGRHSFGHTLIVDPWGRIAAECAEAEGVAVAEIDLDRVAAIRSGMPISAHRRLV